MFYLMLIYHLKRFYSLIPRANFCPLHLECLLRFWCQANVGWGIFGMRWWSWFRASQTYSLKLYRIQSKVDLIKMQTSMPRLWIHDFASVSLQWNGCSYRITWTEYFASDRLITYDMQPSRTADIKERLFHMELAQLLPHADLNLKKSCLPSLSICSKLMLKNHDKCRLYLRYSTKSLVCFNICNIVSLFSFKIRWWMQILPISRAFQERLPRKSI